MRRVIFDEYGLHIFPEHPTLQANLYMHLNNMLGLSKRVPPPKPIRIWYTQSKDAVRLEV